MSVFFSTIKENILGRVAKAEFGLAWGTAVLLLTKIVRNIPSEFTLVLGMR